jgi:hypothetical protein
MPVDAEPTELAGCRVTPITLGKGHDLALGTVPLVWANMSTEALTSFFAFDVKRRVGSRSASCRFVLNVTLVDAPVDRQEKLLRTMLRDRRQLMRFLLLLLGDWGEDGAWQRSNGASSTPGDQAAALAPDAVLEPLLRALDRDPERLDHVERLLRDLGSKPDEALPIGLSEIFEPIWAVRQLRK